MLILEGGIRRIFVFLGVFSFLSSSFGQAQSTVIPVPNSVSFLMGRIVPPCLIFTLRALSLLVFALFARSLVVFFRSPESRPRLSSARNPGAVTGGFWGPNGPRSRGRNPSGGFLLVLCLFWTEAS